MIKKRSTSPARKTATGKTATKAVRVGEGAPNVLKGITVTAPKPKAYKNKNTATNAPKPTQPKSVQPKTAQADTKVKRGVYSAEGINLSTGGRDTRNKNGTWTTYKSGFAQAPISDAEYKRRLALESIRRGKKQPRPKGM